MADSAYRRALDISGKGALSEGPRLLLKGPSRLGLLVVFVFVAVFMVWGGTAPIAGGVIAMGTIAPDGSVRSVQHLEGGLVEAILVHEGEAVVAGQPLVMFRQTASMADVEALQDRKRARLAEAARLEAEVKGLGTPDYPPELLADPAAAAVMEAETRILTARAAMQSTRRSVLRQRIMHLKEQIAGHTAQLDSAAEQVKLIEEEYAAKVSLVEKRIVAQVEVTRLGRVLAEVKGYLGEYRAAIAQARQQIGAAQIELQSLLAEKAEEASLRTSEIRGELVEIEQMLASRRDILERTQLTAPVDGIISNLRIKTEGGVVGAGDPILDIVPTKESLVVDVEVSPLDIDLVVPGREVQVHLLALPNKASPRLRGIVARVAADRVEDERTGAPYYLCRVEVSADELKKLGEQEITVGMPAEAIFVVSERTMIDYLLEPLTDALRKAAREA